MYIMRQVPPSGYIHLMTPNTKLNYFMRFPPEDVPVWLNLFQKRWFRYRTGPPVLKQTIVKKPLSSSNFRSFQDAQHILMVANPWHMSPCHLISPDGIKTQTFLPFHSHPSRHFHHKVFGLETQYVNDAC
jgi:hypothetical protein